MIPIEVEIVVMAIMSGTNIDQIDLKVINKCFLKTLKGELKLSTGKAWIMDSKTNAKLKVQNQS